MKINLPPIQGGFASVTGINERLQQIADALDKMISRDGSLPNSMEAPLDMGDQDIINVNTIKAKTFDFDGVSFDGAIEDALETIQEAEDNAVAQIGIVFSYRNEAETFRDEAFGFRNETSAAWTAVQNNIIAAETIFETVSEAQAQTNALLGLGIGSSYVDADGNLIMSYNDDTVTDLYIDSDGFLTIEY